MASQWPKPEDFDGDIDPSDLVDRFKDHYMLICRYTTDNPDATASAKYVMDIMFQANKVVALLAKNLRDVTNARFPGPEQPPVPNQLVLHDPPTVTQNPLEAKHESYTEGPATDVEEVADVAQEFSAKDLFGRDWAEEDSEEDGDWESQSSEDDSDDDYYEYGSFGDDDDDDEDDEEEGDDDEEEDEASVECETEDQDEAEEQDNKQQDDQAGDSVQDYVQAYLQEQEDEDAHDNDVQDYNYCLEDYEDPAYVTDYNAPSSQIEAQEIARRAKMKEEAGLVGSMAEDTTSSEISRQSLPQPVTRGETPYVRIGWAQEKSPYLDPNIGYARCEETVEHAIKNSANFGVRAVKILYQNWYRSSGDCDLFVGTAADRERLIYNSKSWLPSVENAGFARVKIRRPSPEISLSPYENYSPWINHVNYFRITWVCGDGPYKSGNSKYLLSVLKETLSGHSDSTLAAVVLEDLEIDPYCGDMIVHASEEDVKLLVNKSEMWAQTLIRSDEIELHDKYGHVERVCKHTDLPSDPTGLVTFRIRWNCSDPPYKEYETRGIKHSHICDMLQTALKASGSPSLAAVYFTAVEPRYVSGDVDVYTTQRDRERVIKYAHLWFPHLNQGEFARIPGIYYPKSQTPKLQIEASGAEEPTLPAGLTPSKELGGRKSNVSKRNLEDISQSNLSRSQPRSAKRKRQRIRKQQRMQEEQENQAPIQS
ncbi:uncharacterized protein N7498_008409 [Penicillium cinerascens]|uniref:Uncharacterized protein n=1 Tax=Penicillium cinerascens TaxID=70096 RepID=A0A9W9JIN2_9EURO|nr:uncharacterized protein N7498_008409 [Penicillium cinerascens]KAJ5194971.1 hypothetical protein N7498_008409 [Penicillium cinerascens]